MGLMALALVAATGLLLVDRLGVWPLVATAASVLDRFAFGDTLLHGMLGVMLFAGALADRRHHVRRRRVFGPRTRVTKPPPAAKFHSGVAIDATGSEWSGRHPSPAVADENR